VPKLLAIDGKLRTLGRRLVTDAGGAPCCCVGSHPQCCDSSWLCLPRYVAQCVDGQFRADYCRDARAMTENVTLRVASQRIFTVSNGYRVYASSLAQFGFVLCRASNLGVSLLPEYASGLVSINETLGGVELYRFESSGEVIGPEAGSSAGWPVQYQTAGLGPTVMSLAFQFDANREFFAGANVSAGGSAPLVGNSGFGSTGVGVGGSYQTAGPLYRSCSGSFRQDFQFGSDTWNWNASDSCDGPAAISSRYESASDYVQRGRRIVDSFFSQYELTATRQWCSCEGTGQVNGGTGCSNCGDRATLEPF
jgi:hypothetical protein